MSNVLIHGRFVVCAANQMTYRNEAGETVTHVIAGARHHDSVMNPLIRALCGGDKDRISEMKQGFIDQHGVFMSREEALQVAVDAGQLNTRRTKTNPLYKLFSEDLY